MSSLADLLAQHPFADDEPVLFGAARTWTAGEARRAVAEGARRLTASGLQAGQGVGVMLDGAPVVIAMMSIWVAGGVFVPINPRLPPAALDEVIASVQPSLVLTEAGPAGTGHDRRFASGTAFVLWTSGTTGRPKPVLHTHEAYVELIDRVLLPLRGSAANATTRPSPNLIPVSMAVNAGIYNALFGLRAGAALVVMDRFEPVAFAETVARHGIRSTVLPPAAMTMLNDSDVTSLAPLRFVRSITAPLSPFQARRFTERFGVTVLNSYGQAELGEVIGWTAAMAREHPAKVGAIGRPHPGVDVRIDSPDANGVGELLVRPPNRATGYASGDDLGERVTESGHVRTGDLARVDDDGYVWIEGRVGDLINRGGNKIFPAEVEEVLVALPAVREAAVVGEPDDRLGEVPVAYVVTTAPMTDEELATACRVALVPYKIPVRFERLDALPRTEIGKIQRSLIGHGVADQEHRAPRVPYAREA